MEPTGLGVRGSVPVQTLSCLPPPQPTTPSPNLPGNSTLHLNPLLGPPGPSSLRLVFPSSLSHLAPLSPASVSWPAAIYGIYGKGQMPGSAINLPTGRGSQSSQTTGKVYDLWPPPPLKPSTPSSLFFFFFLKFISFRLQWVFIVVHGLLISVTSLVGEQRF